MCRTRADGGYRCSIIQSISLGFKALTENQTRFLPAPSLLFGAPPNLQNITRASPGRGRGETWSGREGRIHHNNSCFQITTTWGRVVGYILWVERDRGCSFIYLHSQHRGVRVHARVCVCVTRSVIAHLHRKKAWGHPPYNTTVALTCTNYEYVKKGRFNPPKHYNECSKHRRSYRVGVTFLFIHSHRGHLCMGAIMLRAISSMQISILCGREESIGCAGNM